MAELIPPTTSPVLVEHDFRGKQEMLDFLDDFRKQIEDDQIIGVCLVGIGTQGRLWDAHSILSAQFSQMIGALYSKAVALSIRLNAQEVSDRLGL